MYYMISRVWMDEWMDVVKKKINDCLVRCHICLGQTPHPKI